MKLLNGLLGALLWAATLALGAYATWVSFTGRVPWDVLDYLLTERALGMAAGVFLVGVAILWPLSLLCPRPANATSPSRTPAARCASAWTRSRISSAASAASSPPWSRCARRSTPATARW